MKSTLIATSSGVALALALALGAVTGASAQQAEQPQATLLSGDVQVTTPDGDQIANVAHYVFDEDGQIEQVVLSFGGFMGFGQQQVMLPWERFEVSGGPVPLLVLAITQEELTGMPEFRSAAAAAAAAEQQQMQAAPPPATTPPPQ